MKKISGIYVKPLFFTLVFLIFAFLVCWRIGEWYRGTLLNNARSAVEADLISYGNALTTTLNKDFSLLAGLEAFVGLHASDGGVQERFEPFAAGLYTGKDSIRAIQLFTYDITGMIYPIAGNEVITDRSLQTLLNDERPNVRADVKRAVETRKIAVSGPYELRQGGMGFIARKAIYLKGTLWGIAVIVVDLPPVLEDAGLEDASQRYRIALRDTTGQIFYGDEALFQNDPVIYHVLLPEGEWALGAAPKDGWSAAVQSEWSQYQITCLVLVGLLSLLVFFVSVYQEQLSQTVKQRTDELIKELAAHQQAAMALRESEEMFRSLAENSRDYIMRYDRQGRHIYMNQAGLDVCGLQPADIIGKSHREAGFDESLSNLWEAGIQSVFRSGQPYEASFDWESVNGTMTLDWRLSAEFDEQGNVRSVLGVSRDVTAQKRVERALRESEERFRMLYDQAPLAYQSLDIDGNLLEVNQAWLHVLGYEKREDVLGKWFGSFLPGEGQQLFRQRFPMFKARGHVNGAEFTMICKDGRQRIVSFDGQIGRAPDGSFKQTHCIFHDITERKQAEEERRRHSEALLVSEERLRQAEMIAHLGHWQYDLQTRALEWSEGLFRIFGQPQDIVPTDFEELLAFVHPDDRAALDHAHQIVFEQGQAAYEYRIIRRDGEVRYISSNSYLKRGEQGKPVAIFGVALDTTDLKQKERELQRKNREIEHFTYTISHDLKSPLVTVKTFLGYLEQDIAEGNTEQIEQDKQYVHMAVNKMGRLLDELLELSRVGRMTHPPVNAHFRELVGEALHMVAGRIAERNVRLEILGENVLLYGDYPRLLQIWQNLVENAVKFMGSQPAPLIEVGTEQQGRNTLFYVRDNGMGIEAKYHEKIFGLFDKLDPASEGTGLGLALVKQIVELYQGKIWVESAGPGQGSCFWFTLPQAIARKNETK